MFSVQMKMFYKTVFALVVLIFIVPMVASTPLQKRSEKPLELLSIINIEEPCVRQGGLCVLPEDCEPGNLVQIRGVLCPKQRHLGVECCYQLN